MSRYYEITITDDDRGLQMDLRVRASAYPGSSDSYSRQYEAWTPGEAPSVDVESVELQDIVTSLSDYGVGGNLDELDGPAKRHVNDWINNKYADEIRRAVLEQHQREVCAAA